MSDNEHTPSSLWDGAFRRAPTMRHSRTRFRYTPRNSAWLSRIVWEQLWLADLRRAVIVLTDAFHDRELAIRLRLLHLALLDATRVDAATKAQLAFDAPQFVMFGDRGHSRYLPCLCCSADRRPRR